LLRVVSGLRCELVERDVCRELLMNGVRNTLGYRAVTESHGRPTSLTTVTTSTASRSACCWSGLAEEL
jgi:hypothetical protein